jgi:hypothetical protein
LYFPDILRAIDVYYTTFAIVDILLDIEVVLKVGQLPIRLLRLCLFAILREKVPDFVCVLLENITRDYRLLLLYPLLLFKQCHFKIRLIRLA